MPFNLTMIDAKRQLPVAEKVDRTPNSGTAAKSSPIDWASYRYFVRQQRSLHEPLPPPIMGIKPHRLGKV